MGTRGENKGDEIEREKKIGNAVETATVIFQNLKVYARVNFLYKTIFGPL